MTGGKCGENVTWLLSGDTLVISGTGAMDDYDCDDNDNVNYPWWDYNETIKKIIIFEDVTYIGEWAFYACESLTSITIPYSVTSIGDWALCACESLTSITIPNSVTSIGEDAFAGCENLTRITIPGSVTSIGNHTFSGCNSLRSITIPGSVTSIGERAFNFCTRLTSITIPDSVTSIGERAFSACTSLTSITIPDSVISIGEEIFNDCLSLKEIRYPAGRDFGKVLSQGNNAKLIPYNTAPPSAQIKPSTTKPANERKFIPVVNQTPKPIVEKLRWKVEGKTLTVGGVREIKDFSKEEPPWVDSIDNIQKIVIEEGVEKISANAFIDCRRLELLTIPASVKTIGDTAFTACYCGNRLENGGRNVFWCLEDGVLIFKKNPAAKSDSDFSIDVVSWLAVEKNITGFKLEPGVVPKEKFFDRLAKRGNALHVSFS